MFKSAAYGVRPACGDCPAKACRSVLRIVRNRNALVSKFLDDLALLLRGIGIVDPCIAAGVHGAITRLGKCRLVDGIPDHKAILGYIFRNANSEYAVGLCC